LKDLHAEQRPSVRGGELNDLRPLAPERMFS
jgi:hypothetical protein